MHVGKNDGAAVKTSTCNYQLKHAYTHKNASGARDSRHAILPTDGNAGHNVTSRRLTVAAWAR